MLQPDEQPLEETLSNFKSSPLVRKTFFVELGSLAALTVGLIGYGIYQDAQQFPLLLPRDSKPAKASPSPQPDRSPTAVPLPLPTTRAQTAPGTIREIYQRVPQTGTYYAADPLLNSFRREIAGSSQRLCVKLVNGPIPPATGEQQIIVSSLSFKEDGIYVDATQQKFQVGSRMNELIEGKTVWQLLEKKADTTGLMADCLASQKPFAQMVVSNPKP